VEEENNRRVEFGVCVLLSRVLCILLVKISVCSSCELSHRIYVHHTPECFSVSTPKPSLDARNRRRRQEPFASSPAEANILCSTSAIEESRMLLSAAQNGS